MYAPPRPDTQSLIRALKKNAGLPEIYSISFGPDLDLWYYFGTDEYFHPSWNRSVAEAKHAEGLGALRKRFT